VRELGISAGQGYLLARPMPVPEMTQIDLSTLEVGGSVLELRPHLRSDATLSTSSATLNA
jgi:hypothetical protein